MAALPLIFLDDCQRYFTTICHCSTFYFACLTPQHHLFDIESDAIIISSLRRDSSSLPDAATTACHVEHMNEIYYKASIHFALLVGGIYRAFIIASLSRQKCHALIKEIGMIFLSQLTI